MPFRPSPPPVGIRDLIQLRQFQQSQEAQRAATQEDRRNREVQLALTIATNPDVDLSKLLTLPMFSNIRPGDAQGLLEVQKGAGKSKARQEQRATAEGPLAQVLAREGPQPGRITRPQIGPQPPERPVVTGFRARSAEQGIPPEVTERQVGLARLGGEAIRAEERGEAERGFIEDAGTRLAGLSLGVTGDSRTDIDAAIRTRFGPDRAPEIRRQVENDARAKIVEERLLAATPQGRSDLATRANAIAEEFGVTPRQGLLLASGDGYLDPVTGRVAPKVTAEHEQQRYSLAELIDGAGDLRTAAFKAARAGAERGAFIGPVLGADAIQELSRFLGIQDPDVADYELEYRTMVSRILKAIQGSRPSDFDLHFYLGLLPKLTEIFFTPDGQLNPAASRRIDVLERQFRRSANTIFSPEERKEARRLRALPKTAADTRVAAAAERYANGEISSAEFTQEISRWQQSPGRFQKQLRRERSGRPQPQPAIDPNNASSVVDGLLGQ
jgi:hypothetical protein